MSNARCVSCGRPNSDTALCARCEGGLTIALSEVPALCDELETTITRQTAGGPRNGSRSAEKPLVFNLRASEVAELLLATLMGWTVDLEPDRAFQPRSESPAASRWLMSRMDTIRVHKDAAMIHEELTYIIREAWHAVDRPATRSRVKVSACLDESCDGELYAHIPVEDYDPHNEQTHAKITCTECDVTYPADQWMTLGRRVLAMLRGAA